MAFMAFALLASAARVVAVAREARALREQVFAVIWGSAGGKESLMRELKSRGMGLRVKFTLLIVVLVVLIVLMVSVPLSISMVDTQGRNLAQGLEQRARVLLGSISAAAGPFMIDQKALDLASLLSQISAMPEAEYATITGITPRDSPRPGAGEEYVWATNDPGIEGKIGGELDAGLSVLKDEVSPVVPQVIDGTNRQALADVGGLVQDLDRLFQEAEPLYRRTDAESQVRVQQIGKATAALQVRINNQLRSIANHVGSLPEFLYDRLESRYLFYQPIVFRMPSSDIYFRGLVRLSVSAETILQEITRTTRGLYRTISLIALGAIALGALGALILASIIISPIRRLAEGVVKIRDTEDKETLKDHRIEIRQRDEIRVLADNINEMTAGARQGGHRQQGSHGRQGDPEDVPALERGPRGAQGQHRVRIERRRRDLWLLRGRQGCVRRLFRLPQARRRALRPDQDRRLRKGSSRGAHHGRGGDDLPELLQDLDAAEPGAAHRPVRLRRQRPAGGAGLCRALRRLHVRHRQHQDRRLRDGQRRRQRRAHLLGARPQDGGQAAPPDARGGPDALDADRDEDPVQGGRGAPRAGRHAVAHH